MGGRGGSAMIARLTERTQCRDLGESKRVSVIVMDIVLLADLGFSRRAKRSGALIGIARLDDKAFDIRSSGEYIKHYRIAPISATARGQGRRLRHAVCHQQSAYLIQRVRSEWVTKFDIIASDCGDCGETKTKIIIHL
jgi:hypothetical protein